MLSYLSYIYMYLIIIDNTKIGTELLAEFSILLIFWIDIFMEVFHKSFEKLRKTSKF